MANILITGSTDGIGRQTAADLLALGHRVVAHARDDDRAAAVRAALPGLAAVLTGDVATLAGTRSLAAQASSGERFDVVIHNVGVGGGAPTRQVTADGIERIFQINVICPYLLTALLPRPGRLVYLTSGLEANGVVDLDDLQYEHRAWSGMQAYSDSKMYDVALAFAVARLWPDVVSNAVDPGWIKTRMGGPNATDELPDGAETQVWLADSDDPAAVASGRYLKRRVVLAANPAASDKAVQEALLGTCAALTGVTLA